MASDTECPECGDTEFYASTEDTIVCFQDDGSVTARREPGAHEWSCCGCGCMPDNKDLLARIDAAVP